MYARVTRVEGSPEKAEEGIRSFQEQVLPMVRSMDGFKGTLLLVDRQSGKGLGISLWDSEEAMQASEEAVRAPRDQATQAMGAASPTIERYEVAVQEMQ